MSIYILEFIKNYGEEDGFYKINMYYRDFVVLFWDIIDVDCSQDENDDIISIDDEVYENIIKIKKNEIDKQIFSINNQ